MGNLEVYWQRIVEGNAISISLAGMAIVFFALLFISIFIGCLPHVLKLLGLVSEEDDNSPAAKSHVPDEQVVAAIGAVLRYRTENEG